MRIWRLVFVLLVFVACRRDAGGGGGGAGVDARPIRVVSLSPSTTETLFALGAGAVVVGRSRYCNTPPEARAVPVVGGYTDPNFEAIFAATPTLVVGARGPAGPALASRLAERGIATMFPETETVSAIHESILALGAAVGQGERARALAGASSERIAKTAARIAGKRRPRVLLLFDLEPLVAAGPKSFPDELLRLAGGDNVVTEGPPYPVLSLERVLALDPDIILDTTVAMTKAPTRIHKDTPGLSSLRATREGRIVGIDDESVLRPGPRVAEAVERFARALHGER